MKIVNEMRLDFPALPENEGFARMVVSGFILPLNPTLEQLADVKTAVSEAVTNASSTATRPPGAAPCGCTRCTPTRRCSRWT